MIIIVIMIKETEAQRNQVTFPDSQTRRAETEIHISSILFVSYFHWTKELD